MADKLTDKLDDVARELPERDPLAGKDDSKLTEEIREKVRGALANRLILLVFITTVSGLALTIADYAYAMFRDEEPNREFSKDVISLLLTPNVTLAGAAVGFYFGDKSSQS